ncbi:MAG: hypothetical protein KAZ63_04745 [Vitreoscilla sp.]|nr:hypothetical protein [Vitreoscilla sp.]
MTWTPGHPVITPSDHAEWEQWRNDRKRQQQRERRARYPRIDYYPDERADEVIRSRSGRFVGCDFSSVINRIVAEWVGFSQGQEKGEVAFVATGARKFPLG